MVAGRGVENGAARLVGGAVGQVNGLLQQVGRGLCAVHALVGGGTVENRAGHHGGGLVVGLVEDDTQLLRHLDRASLVDCGGHEVVSGCRVEHAAPYGIGLQRVNELGYLSGVALVVDVVSMGHVLSPVFK
ncbi:hypothetical protein D9M69_550210 [compost metagenome]